MRRRASGFAVSVGIALIWLAISTALAVPWARGINGQLPYLYVIPVIIGIALLPGYLMCTMFISNLLNSNLANVRQTYRESVTVLICARNEQSNIYHTIEQLVRQSYEGIINIVCIDNNSADNTQSEIRRAMVYLHSNRRPIRLIVCDEVGKAYALNLGLENVFTRYFITVDADTFLEKNAVSKIICRIFEEDAGCVAGNLLVKHPTTWVQKMQIYDYLISIAAVKRFQGSYNTTLVAQGAFSAYDTQTVKDIGGWVQTAGEDIVLTYKIMECGKKSLYEPMAIGYTVVPDTLKALCKQRIRWAMGMFDGLYAVNPYRQFSFYGGYFETLNISIVFIDISYVLGFLAGIIFLIFGYNWLVGGFTLLVLPPLFIGSSSIYAFQKKLGIKIQNSLQGILCFIFLFQVIQSLCSIIGYTKFILRKKVNWK